MQQRVSLRGRFFILLMMCALSVSIVGCGLSDSLRNLVATPIPPDIHNLAVMTKENAKNLVQVSTIMVPDTMLIAQDVVFNPEGTLLAVASNAEPRRVLVYDIFSGEINVEFPPYHTDTITSIDISNDGSRIVTSSADQSNRVWYMVYPNQQPLTRDYANAASFDAAFDPTNQLRLTAAVGFYIHFFSIEGEESIDSSMKIEPSIDIESEIVQATSVTYSPDGSRHAAGWTNGMVRLWDIAGDQPLCEMDSEKAVWEVAFNPDGTQVVVGSLQAFVIDANTCEVLHTLDDHDDWVWRAKFSPDGSLIATGSADGGVRIWDSATGELLTTVQHTMGINALAFSPDGKILATGSNDGLIFWGVPGPQD